MSATLFGLDLYARHTGVDGNSFVMYHRVYDKDLFVGRKIEAAERENSKQGPGKARLAKFEQITREQYEAERA